MGRAASVVARLGGALIALTALVAVTADGSGATHEPADKTSAAGSETEVIGAPVGATEVLLLSERVKTSKPSDLILGVTLECSITTDVTTVGSDDQTAFGAVRVWTRIDNSPYATHVPVSKEDTDQGRVVFCNRTYQRQTQLGSDDESDSIRTFMETRQANAFNWMALDVGAGVHTIQVLAELTADSTARASAIAVVGNRTLIIEPTKAANDETVTALST